MVMQSTHNQPQSSSHGGDQAFTNDDDSLFKSHILYVLPRDPNCAKVLAMLDTHPLDGNIWQQNVKELQTLPSWLQSVPTLVNKETRHVYKERSLYAYLQNTRRNLASGGPVGGNASTSGLDAAGMFKLEYNESPNEIQDAPAVATEAGGTLFSGGFGGVASYASFDSEGMFDFEATPGEPRTNVVAPSSHMQPSLAGGGGNSQGSNSGVRDSRRQRQADDQAARVQQLLDSRSSLDRRYNPNPNLQKQ